MTSIHRTAATGFARGAETYVTGRPDYPAALDAWLAADLAIGPESCVVELGAGTGKFTARLLSTGASVTAVEPVAEMRNLIKPHPSLQIVSGTAENIPVADGSMDAVICAQAFHWFANGRALSEMRRVLKRCGRLGLIWNVRDENTPWVAAVAALLARYQGDAPQYHTGKWRELFPAPGFGPLIERHFPHGHHGTASQVIFDRVMSTSFMAALPEDEKAGVMRELEEIVRSTLDLAERENITFPYTTVACRLEAV